MARRIWELSVAVAVQVEGHGRVGNSVRAVGRSTTNDHIAKKLLERVGVAA
jgi:hypothetical protein